MGVNEHFEAIFNAVWASAIVNQRSPRKNALAGTPDGMHVLARGLRFSAGLGVKFFESNVFVESIRVAVPFTQHR